MSIISAISISLICILKVPRCIIQTYWFWCSWSTNTRLFSSQVQQNVPWRCFLLLLQIENGARPHPSDFRFHFRGRWCPVHSKTGQYPCSQKWSTTTLHSPNPQCRLDLRVCCPQPITSHEHSKPCHMAACMLSTHTLPVLRTPNILSRHHIHVFKGGNSAQQVLSFCSIFPSM